MQVSPACRARVVALVVCLATAPAARAQDQAGVGAPVDGEARVLSWLERRVDLAESGQFYLVLDPAAPSLALALGGVTLLELPVTDVTVLTPRALFRRAEAPVAWQDTTWLHGTLDPPLPVAAVVPPPSGDVETAATPPPLPDELVPPPDVFDVRFEGGLALRVVLADAGTPRGAGLATTVRERWRVLRGAAPDAVRVELVMEAADAGRFYRALPPDTPLIMAPGPAAPVGP